MKELKHCETSWNTLKTSRNTCHSMRRCRSSMWRHQRSARRYRRSRGVPGDIGDCGVGITPQMFNRITNHGDIGTFSKPVFWQKSYHSRFFKSRSRFLVIKIILDLFFAISRFNTWRKSGNTVWLTQCVTCKVYWYSHVPHLRAQQKMMQRQISYKIFMVNRY